ncbi:hypothetical protein MGLY_20200 [Neomoorella glycerini]|uniref:Uncharacterized protein n=1 Tax=Neomoorella glycerini TaxID=55779 RepID=A0A6I5ZRJ5_9FIRM|nr:hypothetical protein [Moorella glycerini]QGP92633.1 hypothetical protein MGLY_20200 [Moorella glycerini]
MRRAAAISLIAVIIIAGALAAARSRTGSPPQQQNVQQQEPGVQQPNVQQQELGVPQQPGPGTNEPGVQQPGPGTGAQALPAVVKPGDFFPLYPGSRWQYLGEGNEYATFKREVLYARGDRAQIREDNGGTVSAAVFKITEDAVTRVFFQGEAYEGTNFLDHEPGENVVILKAPLAAGTRWETPNGPREIVDVNATVDTPAGKFENCLKVKLEGIGSTIFEYYNEGVGMVKREFISGSTRVTSTLESYEITPAG